MSGLYAERIESVTSRRVKIHGREETRMEQEPRGDRSEVEGWVLESQGSLLALPPSLTPETAEVGVFVQWKGLEGVTVNRVYFLCEVTAKVTC